MKERGQSLVELSVSLVLLLFLLSGAVEFGMAFFQLVQLKDAAQEGALYGSMNPRNTAEIENRIRGSSNSPILLSDSSKVSIIISAADKLGNPKDVLQACEGDTITVQIVFNHHIFMPFIPKLIGRQSIPLRGKVTDTVLYQCP